MSDEPKTPAPLPPQQPEGWQSPPAPPQPQPAPPPAPPAVVEPMTPPAPAPERSGHGGLWAGAILITIGIVFLAGQLLPGASIWTLWPLILVALGIGQAITPGRDGWNIGRFFDGLVTVAFGVVLLGCTTGTIGWGVWWRFIWLWPVLLIAAGLGIVGKATGQRWIGALGSVAVILALLVAASLAYAGVGWPSSQGSNEGGTINFSAPVENVRTATLNLNVGAVEVGLKDGDDLVRVTGSVPWGAPSADVERNGDQATVDVNTSENGSVGPFHDARIDVEISREVSWDVVVKSGAATLDADLSDVPVKGVRLETGASASDIKLGDPDMAEGSGARSVLVKAGVAAVTVLVPENAPCRISFQTGVSANSAPSSYSHSGTEWLSPGFTQSAPYWDIVFQSGVGASTVKTY